MSSEPASRETGPSAEMLPDGMAEEAGRMAEEAGGMAEDVFDRLGVPAGLAAELRRHVRRPVHAYLLLGPHGRTAARAFAAALLCSTGGCGRCRNCRAVVDGHHPDATIVARAGPAWRIEEVRGLLDLAVRAPAAGGRVVLVLPDAHLLGAVAPAVLKTLEEPPATTVLVLAAPAVPPELGAVASRCVRIVEPTVRAAPAGDRPAAWLAEALSGDLPAATRLLVEDSRVVAAADFWVRLPGEVGPEGRIVARLLDEAIAHLDALGDAVLAARVAAEAESGEGRPSRPGSVGRSGPRAAENGRQAAGGASGPTERADGSEEDSDGERPEEDGSAEAASRRRRRVRREVVVAALGLLGSSLAGRLPAVSALGAIDRLTDLGAAWRRNPNERIQLAALLVALAEAVSARSSTHRPAALAGGGRAR